MNVSDETAAGPAYSDRKATGRSPAGEVRSDYESSLGSTTTNIRFCRKLKRVSCLVREKPKTNRSKTLPVTENSMISVGLPYSRQPRPPHPGEPSGASRHAAGLDRSARLNRKAHWRGSRVRTIVPS